MEKFNTTRAHVTDGPHAHKSQPRTGHVYAVRFRECTGVAPTCYEWSVDDGIWGSGFWGIQGLVLRPAPYNVL